MRSAVLVRLAVLSAAPDSLAQTYPCATPSAMSLRLDPPLASLSLRGESEPRPSIRKVADR